MKNLYWMNKESHVESEKFGRNRYKFDKYINTINCEKKTVCKMDQTSHVEFIRLRSLNKEIIF